MREVITTVFRPNGRNVATAVSVTALLVLAYFLVPHPIVQYGVWLVIFTIWMVWFVYAGVDYVYGIESEPPGDADR